MNNYGLNLLLGLVIAMQATLISTSYANTATKTTTSIPATSADRISAATKHKIMREKAKQLEADAVAVFMDTPKAIIALEKKDTKTATEILQGVSTKLDGILAKNPNMSLIPADVAVDVEDYEGGSKAIVTAINDAKDLLKSGKLQEARQILAPMASDVSVSVVSIPLGTFPGVIKQAQAEIAANKIDQAAVTLDDGLNTFVETVEIIPLPVLRAEELLTVAANLEHTKDLSQQQIKNEIEKYTDAARENLKVAELLGYGGKDHYKVLYKEIDAIDSTLFSDKSAGLWNSIKDRFVALKQAIQRIGNPFK